MLRLKLKTLFEGAITPGGYFVMSRSIIEKEKILEGGKVKSKRI